MHNVVLVSGAQQRDSVLHTQLLYTDINYGHTNICVYIYSLFQILSPYGLLQNVGEFPGASVG